MTAMQKDIGLCVQTGNTAAVFRDLFKLLFVYHSGAIKAGVYILPTQKAAEVLGANYANMERLVADLKEYDPIVPLPMLVVGFSEGE